MATGLNASVATAVTLTPISSSMYNSNNANINGAINPSFTNIGCDGVETFTKALGGSNQVYTSLAPTDMVGAPWNTDVLSDEDWALVSGLVKLRVDRNNGVQFMANGGYLAGLSRFSGTGSGTYSHNLGTTPNVVLAQQSAVGSQTMGWDSATSTQVHITTGAGQAFVGLAMLVN